jgi:hypothetical protein
VLPTLRRAGRVSVGAQQILTPIQHVSAAIPLCLNGSGCHQQFLYLVIPFTLCINQLYIGKIMIVDIISR